MNQMPFCTFESAMRTAVVTADAGFISTRLLYRGASECSAVTPTGFRRMHETATNGASSSASERPLHK